MLGTDDQKTPSSGSFSRLKSGSRVLAELKVDKKQKKFDKGDAGDLGYTELKGAVDVLGKRHTRSSQVKEQEGNKKQRLSELKDK